MALTPDDVSKVAHLARLEVTGDELESIASQLTSIIDFVEKLGEINTDGVEEMAHPLDIHSVLRDDSKRSSLTRSQALQNSPNSDHEFFLVPAVMAK